MIFVIIWEIFHERVSLNPVLLLLLVNFVSDFRLELMYISLNIKPHSYPWFSAACAAAIVHRNHFFCVHQQNKSSESEVKYRQASNLCKRVLDAAKLEYATITKESITSQKLGSLDFWTTKLNLLYLLYSAAWRFWLLHLIKQKLFTKNFPKSSNLDDLSISLHVFPCRSNLKLYNISVTPKMVKKVIMNLDSLKVSGPDCIPVVALKNCEPKLSCILAKLFNMCLKGSYFPDWWRASSVVPVFKNVGERSSVKNYRPVSLLFVVSKVFGLLVTWRNVVFFKISSMGLGLLDQPQIFWQLYGVSGASMSGATRDVVLDIFKAFDTVWHATNLSLMEFQVRYLTLFLFFSVINCFQRFWMGSLPEITQLMLEFFRGSFLVLHFAYYTLRTLLKMLSIILLSMLMILIFMDLYDLLCYS